MITSSQEAVAQELIKHAPKPIAIEVSTDDIQALTACGTSPTQYIQLLLAKLKDAGGPVEGVINLRLAHGKLFKMKDNPMIGQTEFTYMWLPDEYVHAIGNEGHA